MDHTHLPKDTLRRQRAPIVERKTSTFDANSGIDDRRDEDGRRVDDDAIAIAVDEGDVPRDDAQDCDVSDISDSSPSSLVSVKRC